MTCADVNCNNAGNINCTKCKIVTKKDRTDCVCVNDHDERANRLSVSHENISYDNNSSCSNVFVDNVNGNCTISNGNCSISNDVIDSDTSIQCHTKNQAHVFDDKSLNFAHVNIVTLPGKIDQVRHLLDNHSIDIMGFAETRLDESIPDNDVEIENYTLYRKDRIAMVVELLHM